MPADKSNIGTGRRRQGDTEPDQSDDRNRSLDRSIGEGKADDALFERGKEAGAHGETPPHRPIKPGTLSDLEDTRGI